MTERVTERETLETVAGFIHEVVGEDWEFEEPITMETNINDDLELESIEFVALAEKLVDEYGDEVDFTGWLAEMEFEEIVELTVGDIVNQIESCR